jgi:DNA-directed RNA polymerase specialized sigma24 family protein
LAKAVAVSLVTRALTEPAARSSPKQPESQLLMGFDTPPRLHDAADNEHVLDAMRDLSAGDQQLLLLVARQHLDHDQLAALLGVSTTTAAGRLYRARVRLAQTLAAREIESLAISQPGQ